MEGEHKELLLDVIGALEDVREVIKEYVAKYEIHSFTKEKSEEIFYILQQIKTIFDRMGWKIDSYEKVYVKLMEVLLSYDLCTVSKAFEEEIFEGLSETIEILEGCVQEPLPEEKRTIKVKYIDFYPEFKPEAHWLYKLLIKKYNVVFSEKPDYLFYSCFGNRFLQYNCIRVYISNEAVYPNFNLCDYAITYADFKVSDRFLPNQDAFEDLKYKQLAKDRDEAEEIYNSKTEFCNYVYSNGNGDPYRTELFYAISKYRQVLSGGRYLNNIGQRVDDLEEFQSKFRFSIACENSLYKGYTTEKIINAINAKTIPIYWGNEDISKIINPKAIINCHDYENMQEVVNEIIRLEQDKEAYIEKLMQPMLVNERLPEEYLAEREQFLYNIIDQPYAKAFRRNRCLRGQWYNDWFCCGLGYPNEWFSEEKGYFVKKKSKKNGPLVSILIPVYNRRNIIKDAVDSALSQTWENTEIIIVDNCSTDGTFEELQRCYGNHNNVKIYKNDTNIGPVNNWKVCLEKASGKYVKILWSDDMITDDFVEKCVNIMEEDSTVGMVFSSCFVFMEDNKNEGFYLHHLEGWDTGKYDKQAFYKGMFQDEINLPVSPGCAMFRREDVSIMDNIPNDLGINCNANGAGIDLMIYLQALNKYPNFYYFKEVLSYFRYHKGSITATNNLVREYNLAKVYYCMNWEDARQYVTQMQMRILRDEKVEDEVQGLEVLRKYGCMGGEEG